MKHNFMPGDKVIYKNNKARVMSRGAFPKTYFVEIRYDGSGNIERVENEDIRKITKV